MLQADPNRIKVRVEMSMEQLQQMAQHRALLRQAGIGQQPRLSRELRRLLGAVGAVWVALGARRKPPSPDLGMESMHSHGQRRESPSLAPE